MSVVGVVLCLCVPWYNSVHRYCYLKRQECTCISVCCAGADAAGTKARPSMTEQARSSAALEVQRVWRGVRDRRIFSDLFFDAAEAALATTCSDSLLDSESNIGSATKRSSFTPSLEEAHEEASYKYDHHMSAASTAVSTSRLDQGGVSVPSSPMETAASTPQAKAMTRWASAAGLQELNPAASAPADVEGNVAPGAAVATGSARAAAATGISHRRTLSESLHRRAESVGARRSLHQRCPSEGLTAPGRGGNGSANDGTVDGASGLEFTEEMAENMSLEALRELSGVLTRIIGTRNKELVTLLERRDELRHERDFRQATVTALVAQVDRSQFVREEAKRKAAATSGGVR